MKLSPIPAIRPLWRAGTRYKIAEGGRGSGKTYGVGQRFVTFALKEKCRILCTKETQNSLGDSVLAVLKRVISDLGLDAAFVQTKHGLSCLNGSEFIFRGLQHPDRIKSLDGVKYCWVEEAHSVTQDAWDILIPTIREPNSEIWVTFNRDQETDPVCSMFLKANRPDATIARINWQDNPYFPDVLRQELEWDKANDYDKYQWVWEGNYRKISDALVFKGKFRVDTFDPPEDAVFRFGGDWGFSQDPSTLVRCYVHDGRLWIDHEAYSIGVDIDKLPEFYKRVPGSEKWRIIADSERPDTINYMRARGYNIVGAKKGAGSVEEGVAFLRSFREIVIHERCKHTTDEFKTYSYKTDKLTNEVLPVLEDKNNHCIDALRYATEDLHGLEPRIRTI